MSCAAPTGRASCRPRNRTLPFCGGRLLSWRLAACPPHSGPVSSCRLFMLFKQGLKSSVVGGVVGGVVLPAVPDGVEPGAGEDAHGELVTLCRGRWRGCRGRRPRGWRGGSRWRSRRRRRAGFVAGPAVPDDAHLSGFPCGGRYAGQRHQRFWGGESGAAVPDFAQKPCGADGSGSRQAGEMWPSVCACSCSPICCSRI